MKRTFIAVMTAAALLSLTSCGESVPKWDGLGGGAAEGSDTARDDIGADNAADGNEVYAADGELRGEAEDAYSADGAAEDSPAAWGYEDNEDYEEHPIGMTEGFVGSFAFDFDADVWDSVSQPGVGYQLTYAGAEGCSCEIVISADSSADIDEITEGLLAMYGDEAEFGAAADGESGGMPVRTVHGSSEDGSVDILLSQPEEGGEVLVVQCVLSGASADGSEQAADAAEDIMQSFRPR